MFWKKYPEPLAKAYKEGFKMGFNLMNSLATLVLSVVTLWIRFH
jgi:hypothetical protein